MERYNKSQQNKNIIKICSKFILFQNGQGDANDVWRVEVQGGKDGDPIQTVTSKIKFYHYFLKCVLTSTGKQLPKWGYEQQEVSCNPTTRDSNALWNVEDNFHPKCKCN